MSTPVAAELVSAEMAAAAALSGAVGVPITLILYLVAQELSERTEVLVAAVAGELMATAVAEATVVTDRTWTRHSPAPAWRADKQRRRFVDITPTFASTPEPGSVRLFGTVTAGFGLILRRKLGYKISGYP